MILIPSRYLVKVSLKNKSYLVLYHSLFGGAIKVKQGVWNLIQRFKGGRDFPHSFSKEETSAYHDTIHDLKKRYFLVKQGLDERSLFKIDKRFKEDLIAGHCIDKLRLEMASYCNFSCLHCFGPKIYNWRKREKMDFRTAKLAVDGFIYLLKKAGKKAGAITFWGGEPLLNWNVIKQTVEYVFSLTRNSSIIIEPGIITNGSLLNNRILEFIKQYGMLVRVSLDGLEKENDRFRKFINGKGTFKSIIKGMDGLSKYGIEFSVELCLNDYNFNSVEKVLDFLKNRYKCKNVAIGLISYQKSVSNFDHHSNQKKAKRIVEIYDYALKKKITLSPAGSVPLLKKAIKQGFSALHGCYGIFESLYVNPAGLVFNCHRITSPIGTVEQIKKIPQGKKYKYAAKRTVEKIKGCKGCEIEGFCNGGCAGTVQFYSGEIYDTSHPLCQSFYCDVRRQLFKEMLKYYVNNKIG